MANALGTQTSPYLLQHARNPVDWHSWGDAAICLARESDKPILLSVGYSACHRHYHPEQLTLSIPPKTPALPKAIAAQKAQGKPVAYICQGTHCSAPIDSLETLEVQLSQRSAPDDA